MKRQWNEEELIEQWTLLPDELILAASLADHNRLGFAILLKFFQHQGCFPGDRQQVPTAVIGFLARQLGVSLEDCLRYDWQGPVIKRHRAQIRILLGFRQSTEADIEQLTHWLVEQVLPTDPNPEHLPALMLTHLRTLRIEPPAEVRLQRLLASALRRFEQQFYTATLRALPPDCREKLDALLCPPGTIATSPEQISPWQSLDGDPGSVGLGSIRAQLDKLEALRRLGLPENLFAGVTHKLLLRYRTRAAGESMSTLRAHPASVRYTLLAAYCRLRQHEITDALVDLLLATVHRIESRAEQKTEKVWLRALKRVDGKHLLLYKLSRASLADPDRSVREMIFPVVSEQTLQDIVQEHESGAPTFRKQVRTQARLSYSHHYRRMLPQLLQGLELRSNNQAHQPVVAAVEILDKYKDSSKRFFPEGEQVPLAGVVPPSWQHLVLVPPQSKKKKIRIDRIGHEICTLVALREKLRCREVWVVGADRYRNPELDLPADFTERKEEYFQTLGQPAQATEFVAAIQKHMGEALESFDRTLPTNSWVHITERKGKKRIHLSPLIAQAEPISLTRIRLELVRRWPMTSLLDILKEADLSIGFTDCFHSTASRENLERSQLQRRLLLCLFGLGTNTGLKRIAAGDHGVGLDELRYIQRRFISKEALRSATAQVANAIFAVRLPQIWGEGSTACASDSKKFGAWDQNLLTEWHVRYGGRGVMIYWHVEKKSTCIYSQLKSCSSSEVAAMIEGVLRHSTTMSVQKNYVDTHGQSEVAFAFCHLLGFQLLPRLKGIAEQKLYRPQSGQPEAYPNLQAILTRPIDWELISQQYEQMVKYATALRLGTADTESILKRFVRSNVQHPTYRALAELGKAIKTIFLCRYLQMEELRREIQEGLNVVESWNSANGFIFYGKGGEVSSNRREEQELSVLSLHLLQICLVYVNTLMMQRVLTGPGWLEKMTEADMRGLTPLVWAHVNPYGTFSLDLDQRLVI